ncbi:type II secretion system F family protein [Kitasatospora sp. NBC_00240]|uniref:type II secretion system F family protein n=1 Tax=Kitasatospora sp. NBC_00240 TaxID=2903567 RepID=UPI0022583A6B|nr:type II secretion system F family protein [Kitasatospora sp. NBC_00240]MCX5215697.1 type II secretion system F family protein [Kitasatospora sp. NBC_00240]
MITSAPAIIGGASLGVGVAVAITGFSRSRADLGDLLHRNDASRLENLEPRAARAADSLLDTFGARLLAQVGEGFVRLPRQELDLLGRSPAQHVGQKIGYAIIGLMFPPLAIAVLSLVGVSLPFTVPALAGLVMGVLLWLLPDINVKEEAEKARKEFRYAIASYLELVCLERAADAGPSEALRKAADIGDGWVFGRVRDALTRAELAGIPPWDGLKQLSEELGVPELGAPADIMALAGEQGAAVYSTLAAQAKSLRGVLLTDAQAEANAVSEKMIVPVSALVILMSIFVAFPAIMRIMAS